MGLLLFTVLRRPRRRGRGRGVAAYCQLIDGSPGRSALLDDRACPSSRSCTTASKVELARFGEFNRQVVAFEDIPPILVDATTAIEDRTFWENAGFDPIGIMAAGARRPPRAGRAAPRRSPSSSSASAS